LALLRASNHHAGRDFNLHAVISGDPGSYVLHGSLLSTFADAVLGRD